MKEEIGFIGLGKMGVGMVEQLIRKTSELNDDVNDLVGSKLHLYNRTTSKCLQFEKDCIIHTSIASISSSCTIVFLMLADDQSTLEAAQQWSSSPSSAMFVNTSTIHPKTMESIIQICKDKEIESVATAVFGRPDRAAEGKLINVVSGSEANIERIEPLVKAFGPVTLNLGNDLLAAPTFKLCGNFFISGFIELIGETMTLADKSGVVNRYLTRIALMYKTFVTLPLKFASHQILEFLLNFFPNVPSVTAYGTKIADLNFTADGGFTVSGGKKDVSHISDLASSLGVKLPIADATLDHLKRAEADGLKDMDWSALATIIRKDAKLENS